MRKHLNGNGNGRNADQFNEIDLSAIVKTVRKYWWGYSLAGIVCALASYGYYFRTLPPPESHLRLEIGFNNISSGRYPDGSLFNKSDLISDDVLRTAYEKAQGSLGSKMWTLGQFAGFFSVEGIYPIELELLKNQLQANNNAMKPEEVAVGNAKLLKFFPLQYEINFVPPPVLSDEVRSQILDSIVKNFSTRTAKDHMMLLWKNEHPTEFYKENTSAVLSMYYLESKAQELEQLVSMVNAGMFSAASGKGESDNGVSSEKSASDKVIFEEITRGRTQATRLSFQSSLSNIKSELLSLDALLFDEKALIDVEGTKRGLEAKVMELVSHEEILGKQEQFRLSLTKRPGDVISDKVGGRDSDVLQGNGSSGHGQSGTIMGMMLTFNDQYYSLLKEAKTLNDQRLRVLSEIKVLRNRLDRLQAPMTKKVMNKEALFRRVDEKIANVSRMIDQLSSDVVREGNNILMSTEPPIRNFFISHQHYNVPLKKVCLIGFAAMGLVASLQVTFLLFSGALTGREQDGIRGDSAFKFGSKIAGKN